MNILDRPNFPASKLQTILEDAFNGLKIFNLLKTSVKMGLFNILTENMTCKQLSDKLGIDPVLVHYLLETLVKLELVEERGDFYKDTSISELYLNSKSDYKRINCILSLDETAEMWNNLSDTLKGKLPRKEESFFPFIIQVMAEDCLSGELQDTINFVANYDEFKHANTLLDLAGGHGLYSIAFNKMHPTLQCYVFDLPEVLVETRKFIEKYDSNVKIIPGNFYTDDFRGNYDIIFSSYNPGGKNSLITEKVYNSLNLNGLFVNKQYFPEESSGTLGDLLDNMEWNFTNFEKSNKSTRRFSFRDDLSLEDYLKFLESLGFSIIDIKPITHLNVSFGTVSEDKIIIAKKVS